MLKLIWVIKHSRVVTHMSIERKNISLHGDVLEGVKKVQKQRNFPSLSYTGRVLIRERLTAIGILKSEEEHND